jgi:cell wall-associated NlpC family hydrolase
VVIKTKVLTTAVALLTSLLVTLPAAQGQANAKEIQETLTPNSGVLGSAHNLIGTPYCRGGSSTRCFDCSGFVQYVYKQHGIDLPHNANGQRRAVRNIPASQAVPGDLVFFVTSKGYAYHVGIYVGNGKVLHSPKHGQRVRIATIWSRNVRFGRV